MLRLIVVAALAAAQSTDLRPVSPSHVPRECPVTVPNGRSGPGADVPPSAFGHGNGTVSTSLWPDGTVVFRPGGPGTVLNDGALRMKSLE